MAIAMVSACRHPRIPKMGALMLYSLAKIASTRIKNKLYLFSKYFDFEIVFI
jgi:hypothetical protein